MIKKKTETERKSLEYRRADVMKDLVGYIWRNKDNNLSR